MELHTQAHALRPCRLLCDRLRLYTATTFPNGPWRGCELILRRCKAFGLLKDDGSGLLVDVLAENGDIVQDFPVTREGFEYLRRQLRFCVEAT